MSDNANIDSVSMISIEEGQGIEDKLVKLLIDKKLTVSTAESCTGGLVSATLVNVSGVSEVFKQGFVTYSNKAKRKALGVKKSTLEEVGAVSKKVAKQMAIGAAINANADVAISTTGIAGPDGGTDEKPVGLVYIGLYVSGATYVKECHFEGNRSDVRNLTVVNALNLLYNVIK